MTDRLTPADPDDRKALFAAYAAVNARAADLGTTIYDDSIVRAAYEAVRPLLLAEGRRQAARAIREADTTGWPGGRGADVDRCQELAAKIAEADDMREES